MRKSFLLVLMSIVLSMPTYSQQSISSIADALKRLPAMPTVEQLSSSDAKQQYESRWITPFNAALEQGSLSAMSESIELTSRMQQARQKQSQRNQQTMQVYDCNVSAGLMPSQQEMMQILMSSGIDLEKASDQQIMDVVAGTISKKWGVSKDEYLKIINMAQRNPKQTETYLQTNHPDLYKRLYAANNGCQMPEANDAQNERYGQIYAELQTLLEQMTNAMNNYRHPSEMYDPQNNLWDNSSEAKQVKDLENALWQRIEQWESTLSSKNYGDDGVTFPSWFTAERKKENALIDQWNRREAQRWLDVTSKYQSELKAIFEQVVTLENENEQLSQLSGTDNMMYLMNKQQILMFRNELSLLLVPYHDALTFPAQDHQEEIGKTYYGKG